MTRAFDAIPGPVGGFKAGDRVVGKDGVLYRFDGLNDQGEVVLFGGDKLGIVVQAADFIKPESNVAEALIPRAIVKHLLAME